MIEFSGHYKGITHLKKIQIITYFTTLSVYRYLFLFLFTVLSLQILNSKTLQDFHFPIRNEIATDEKGIIWLNMQDSLLLPRQAVKDYGSNGNYPDDFILFKLNMH